MSFNSCSQVVNILAYLSPMKLMPGKNEKVQSSMFKILWHYVWEFADLIGMWGVTSKGYWTNEWRLCHFQ
jgi:hypothetical protein